MPDAFGAAPKVAIQNRRWFPWLLMGPTLLILFVVGIFPFGYSIWLASTNMRE